MSLIPTVYESTDPGAPQLTGQAGSLTALLDAVLVDGYGVGAARKAGAGWTREFSGTNVRAYRGNIGSGSGYYLQIDDSASVGNARHAWARGFEAMSAIGVGENAVPTSTQRARGALLPKSTSADSTSRRWRVVANERFLYLFVDTSTRGFLYPWFAGDIISYKPGDAHGFVVSANNAQSWTGSFDWSTRLFTNSVYTAEPENISCSMYIARNHIGVVGAKSCDHFGVINGNCFGGTGSGGFPSGINQGLLYEPARFVNGAFFPRGELPGLLAPMQILTGASQFADGAVLEGVEEGGGDKLLAIRFSRAFDSDPSPSFTGVVLVRINSEWSQ